MLLAPAGLGAVFTVNLAGDDSDGTCDAVTCTLREAIDASNALAGPDQIFFDLPLGGTTIALNSALSALAGQLTVDGTTQPGYPSLRVVVDGSSAGSGNNGFVLTGSGNVITGLVISGFSNRNLWIMQGGNTLSASFVGTDATGTAAVGTPAFSSVGVQGGSGNTIGGATAADGNVIVGGLTVFGAAASGTIVRNNRIGVDANGTAALGTAALRVDQAPTTAIHDNVVASIDVQSASGTDIRRNRIGTNAAGTAALTGASSANGIQLNLAPNTTIGATDGDGNVVSGKAGDGIRIQDSTGVVVKANRIGTSLDGLSAIPNSGDGILTIGAGTPPSATIGGIAAGDGNTIAHNAGAGVAVFASAPTGIVIRGNAIYGNGGLAIDLGSDGPTANDVGDVDTGPNGLQNRPAVETATQSGSGAGLLTVGIGLSGKLGTVYSLDVYAGPSCGTREWIGTTDIQTAPDDPTKIRVAGSGSYVSTLSLGYTSNDGAPEFASATVTGPEGTSELSDCTSISGTYDQAQAGPTFTVTSASDHAPDGCTTVDCTIREAVEAVNGSLYGFGNPATITIPGDVTGTVSLALTAGGLGELPSIGKYGTTIDGNDAFRLDGNGDGPGEVFYGLHTGQPAVTVRDMVITRFQVGTAEVDVDSSIIGTDAASTPGLGNQAGVTGSLNAISVTNSTISGNGVGIELSQEGAGITGNRIGVAHTGSAALGNTGDGIVLDNLSEGEASIGPGNEIAFNGGAGVHVSGGQGGKIRASSIHDNGGLGILVDGGASSEPAPTITAATLGTGQVTVDVSAVLQPLDGAGSNTGFVDVFASPTCDAGGAGEGAAYLGSISATEGTTSYSDTFPSAAPAGWVVTATLSGSQTGRSTSPFSSCVTLANLAFVVNSTADPGAGTCDAAECTLREAMTAANAAPGPSTIEFAIPGSGPHLIDAGSNLPDIGASVVIDGSTQSGYAGTPVVEVRGPVLGPEDTSQAFFVAAAAVTIRGLSITRWSEAVKTIAPDLTVQDSWIGVTPDGAVEANDTGSGIVLTSSAASITSSRIVARSNGVMVTGAGASGNTIGGDSSAGEGNLIHGFSTGVSLESAGTGNRIQGNVIGLGPSGSPSPGPGGASNGVYVQDSPGTVVGADAGPGELYNPVYPGFGNVIAGITGTEGGRGIFVGGAASGTRIAFNSIGTGRDGTATTLGIDGPGISTSVGASGVQIGPGNEVAYNAGAGVAVLGGTGNRIVANSIHDNGGLGIALLGGANNSGAVGPPTAVTAVVDGPGTATVAGTMSGTSNRDYFVEIFTSSACDASGFGEGRTYAAFVSAITDESGSTSFSLPGVPATPGDVVTVTATDSITSDTTSFSQCAPVGSSAVSGVSITALAPTVQAGAGRVPLADVPPAAFLTGPNVGNRASPINDVPVNDVLLRNSPVNDIPVNDVGLPALGPELGDVLLSTVPLLRTGGWEQALQGTDLAGRPLQNVSLRDVFALDPAPAFLATLTLDDLDLSKSPLGRISAVAYALGPVTLSQLHLQGTSWCEVLQGPPINCPTTPVNESTTTMLSLGIQGAPINDVPINDIPVNDVPIDDIPVNDVPINDITVHGTPINDVPINDVPVNDVPVNDVPINDIPVNDIPINDVATRSLPINDVPVNDIPVNDIPVNDVPVNEVPVNDIPVNDVPVNEVPVNDIPVNDILLAGSPVNDIPVNDIAQPALVFDTPFPTSGTLGQNAASLKAGATLGDLRRALQGGGAPDDLPDSVTFGTLTGGFGDTTIGDLIEALSAITYGAGQNPPTLAQVVGLIKNYAGTDPVQPSFGDLFDLLLDIDAANASVDLTLTDLAHLLFGSDATLADLLATVLTSSDLGWERLDLDGLGISQFADSPDAVSFDVVSTISGSAGTLTVRATLPEGFTYVPGSSQAGTAPPLAPVADPLVNGNELTWTVPGAAPPSLTLRFTARPGTRLGPTQVAAEAHAGAQPPVAAPAPATVTVTETYPNASLTTPQPIAGDAFYLSYVSSSADGDAYSLPAPPAGSRVTINLSHLPADFDVVVYGPGGQVLVPASSDAVPLDGQPVADDGTAPTHTIDSLPAQVLGDVPVVAGRNVVGISANRTTQDDAVVFVSGGTGEYIVQVSGFNGAASTEPYMLRAEVLPPRAPAGCTPRTFPNAGTAAGSLTTAPPANGVNTVFVVNRQQLERIYGTTAATGVISSLDNGLGASFPSSVLQVDALSAVQGAYDAWNACPADAGAANAVVTAVGGAIRDFRVAHPTVDYVVLVGGDDVVPFARLDDRTTLSNEEAYARTFASDTSLGGSLTTAKMLSDDPYGTTLPVPFFDRQLYVPEVAVGRLVETPTQIQAQLAAFGSGEIAAPTALTTGYDFLTDGAQSVRDALQGFASVDDQLISETWTAGQLQGKLQPASSAPPSVVSINAHADHSRFQAADGSLLDAGTLAGALTFDGRIVFSMGCHAGLNVPDAFLPPSARLDDWAQTFVEGGAAVFVANTGFGYGDTDVVAYSEDLSRRFAENLAQGLSAGEALTRAKQEFKGDLALVGVYDEKAMAELTLYGLPQYAVAGLQPQSLAAAGMRTLATGLSEVGATTLSVATLAALTTDPVTGLAVESFSVDDSAALESRRVDRPRGSFYRGRDGVVVTHLRPLEPKAVQPIDAANAHGALITGLRSVDVGSFDPLFARPTVDSSASEPEIPFDEAAFPARLQSVTTIETFSGRRQKLVLAQGQFFSANPTDGSQDGFQRLFTRIDGHVFTSASGDYAPPLFRTVDAVKTGGTVTFTTDVDAGAGDTVKRVLVLYLDGSGGDWTPLDLVLADGRWTASAAVSSPAVQYFVQAVDESGNVSVSTNKGFYYAGAAAPAPTGDVLPTLDGPQASGSDTYVGPVQVGATAPEGVVAQVSVDGGAFTADLPVTVTGDGTHAVVVEGSDGSRAEAAFTIDTTGPVVSVVGPAGGTSGAATTITFTVSEPATLTCTLDGSPFTPCQSPAALSGLGSGSHTFSVQGLDALGNAGQPASTTWAVDLDAPDTMITAQPADPSNSPAPGFSFTATEAGSTFECKLDGGAFNACTTPKGYSGLLDGPHTFSVRAVDPAGNPDPSPASTTWTIDTVPPVVTLSGGPAEGSVSSVRTADFEFDADETVTFACSLDGGAFAACDSPVSLSGLEDGTRTFQVRGTDTAGNAGLSALRTWVVDASGPAITITTPLDGSGYALDASATTDYSCSDAPGPAPTCVGVITAGPTGLGPRPSGTALPTGKNGAYTLTVTSIDAVGNTSTATATYTVGTLAGAVAFARGGAIWVVRPEGDGAFAPRQLTQLAGLDQPGSWIDEQPSVSPDGTRVVFARRAGAAASPQLWVIDAAGRNPKQLIVDPSKHYTAPDWAPGGAHIAFESTRTGSKGRDIWTATYAKTVGGTLSSLANRSNANGDDVTPDWGPLGARLAFASNRNQGQFEIYTMLANGSAQKRMTSNSRTDIEPAFSPTGALIAFSSDRAGGSGGFELYVMAGLTGNAQLRITSSPGADGQPHFVAPLSLVFASARTAGAGAGLYSMSPSAVPPVKLAGTSPGDQQPG